ncbi:MAG: GIY-YIG nuclease family protein [Anaerolineae bacterium]|nr:GIY-YIG nuclease family protein [Anaerolineae bacterium]
MPHVSFVLPCVIGQAQSDGPVFSLKYRTQLAYARNHPVLHRFIARFYNEGNLCIGGRRYFVARDFEGDRSLSVTLMQNACFDRGQKKFGKSLDNIRIIQLAGKPVEKSEPTFKTSKRAALPLDGTDYVYLIRAGRRKIYKIGKSNDPPARLNSLQTASPEKLKLLYAFKADNASAAEEALHFALRDFQMAGEWFKLSDEQVAALLEIEEFREKSFVAGARLFGLNEIVARLRRP